MLLTSKKLILVEWDNIKVDDKICSYFWNLLIYNKHYYNPAYNSSINYVLNIKSNLNHYISTKILKDYYYYSL